MTEIARQLDGADSARRDEIIAGLAAIRDVAETLWRLAGLREAPSALAEGILRVERAAARSTWLDTEVQRALERALEL